MNERHAATGDDVDGQYWICEYFRMLSQGFVDLLSTIPQPSIQPIICSVVLDSSFGVGSITAEQFLSYYNGSFKDTVSSSVPVPEFDIDICNRARSGRVNEGCGAEHVQKLQLPPAGVDPAADSDRLLCSFDGDGDRLVFHIRRRPLELADCSAVLYVAATGADGFEAARCVLVQEKVRQAPGRL